MGSLRVDEINMWFDHLKFIDSLLIAQYFSTSSSLILTTDSSSIRLSVKRKTYQCRQKIFQRSTM